MKQSIVPYIVIPCVLLLGCCLCLIILTSAGIISTTLYEEPGDSYKVPEQPDLSTPVVIRPTSVVVRPDESPMKISNETFDTLDNAEIPIHNLLDLAYRLEGKTNIPIALDPVLSALQEGNQDSFWVLNSDTEENFKIDATLRYVTDHAYFWIQNDLKYNEAALEKLADTFENEIYPFNRKFFGEEWSPGVDGDPHLYIIYAEGLGFSLAGYFSPTDEYHPLAHEYSNMHETFMLNADNIKFDKEYTYGVLAHEFQHMIHWNQDRNEDTWINEGLSELASFINGYDVGGFDFIFTQDPDLQLNNWPNENSETAPHYGASFLFLTYFFDRFGEEAIRALVAHQDDGISGMEGVLTDLDARDRLTGARVRADDVFLDWVLANFLLDGDIFDGRFTYHNYPEAPRAELTEKIRFCSPEKETRVVHQYGADYIWINCRGDHTLKFQGSLDVNVLPSNPHSGNYYYWSNRGDDSDMTLTRSFDFTNHNGPLTLTYWTWFDIEQDYDYLYLVVSSDGENWQILTSPSGTPEDLSGLSYGWGYTGLSGKNDGWIQEKVDISQFAGQQIQIRFEYITDGAVNGEGFLIDDISIPEVGYFSDFEDGSDVWAGAGFVRIQNVLPQIFRLALIENGRNTQVSYIELGADNTVEIPLHIDGEIDDVVLVVAGSTRFTRQTANYQFQILP